MKLRYFIIFTILLVGFGFANADELTLPPYGIVKVGTACMRSNPRHSAEMVSQAVMGTPLNLLEKEGSWWLVETPEGYKGYVIGNAIATKDSISMARWRATNRVMYTATYTSRIVSADGKGTPISDIHSGSVIETIGKPHNDSIDIALPDGRRGRLPLNKLTKLTDFKKNKVNPQSIIDMASELMGVSYLWGGTTTQGIDCSGLVKICYLNQGVILRRDASEQALTGQILDNDFKNYRQGDLVFFKSESTGRIVHVGIYDKNGLYVHSSGRVRVNSLDPTSPLYVPSNIHECGSRIIGYINTDGITFITESPAYFNLPESR